MLIGNGKLYTNDPDRLFISDGAVLIKGDTVADVGNSEELKTKYPDEEFIDVSNRVIMSGMINMHTHIYSSFARGMSVSEPTRNFLEILENQWWRMDKLLTLKHTELSAYQTMIESVRNGVTCMVDHHASPYHITGSLFKIAEVSKKIGIRSDLCYEVSDRDGEDKTDEGIKENIDFIKEYNNSNQDLVHGHFGIHASFTISDKTMHKIATSMSGLDAGYHVHTAEGIEDEYDSLKKYGKRVVERLEDFDFLGEKTLCVHCCNINNREIQILSDTKTNVVHNPESNMGNAVGVTPLIQLLKKNVKVGLGTDAYTNDMFESVKVAKILQSHHLCDPTVGFNEAFKLQIINNPSIASSFFAKPVGIIKKGAYADIITLSYKNYTPMNADNFAGHMIFGMSGRMVNDTIINGKFVMKDRIIQTVDEDKIFAESEQIAHEIWEKM